MAKRKQQSKDIRALLDEIEECTIKMRLKILQAMKIHNDQEAVRRILRELLEMT